MPLYSPVLCGLALLIPFGQRVLVQETSDAEPPSISWKTTCLDPKFRSEGVAVLDVNRDGQLDVAVGQLWYEAPNWKPHEIAAVTDYGDGASSYSEAFECFANDINRDGWSDLIVIGMPGTPCHWFENPRGQARYWRKHVIWHSACNESPIYADLFGDGQKVLIMGFQSTGADANANEGQMACFRPGADPYLPWEMRPISGPSEPDRPVPGTHRFAHGLGVGDVNGDGRADVLCTGGWWEQPAEVGRQPWTFHAHDLGPDCAHMFTADINADGLSDVLSTSAHKYGIWWHEQSRSADGRAAFVRHDLFAQLFSQTHALHWRDMDGDGLPDLITGKRWWAHGPKGDPDSDHPAVLYWFQSVRDAAGHVSFVPHRIDDASGVGTQFEVTDINGDQRLDIITSNKRGVFVFEQLPAEDSK